MKPQEPEFALSQLFFEQLSEKDKRLFAAQEARRRGWGGIGTVSKEYGIARSTISLGIVALQSPETLPPAGRIRKPGGGRKPRLTKEPALHTVFLEILDSDIAGSPQSGLQWTHLSKPAIQQRFQERGYTVGIRTITALLKHHGFGKRKHHKTVTMAENAERDAQFQRITALRAEYSQKGAPIVSMDTKKRS